MTSCSNTIRDSAKTSQTLRGVAKESLEIAGPGDTLEFSTLSRSPVNPCSIRAPSPEAQHRKPQDSRP